MMGTITTFEDWDYEITFGHSRQSLAGPAATIVLSLAQQAMLISQSGAVDAKYTAGCSEAVAVFAMSFTFRFAPARMQRQVFRPGY